MKHTDTKFCLEFKLLRNGLATNARIVAAQRLTTNVYIADKAGTNSCCATVSHECLPSRLGLQEVLLPKIAAASISKLVVAAP